MSEALTKYQQLEGELVRTRWIHRGIESPEEDVILEKMDSAWSRLTAEEQVTVDAAPVRSLLREGPITRSMVDEDVWSYQELPPRRKEAA